MKLVWFRTDLRSVDNTALNQALSQGDSVAALFIATPGQWHSHRKSLLQADLIYRRLFELQKELELLNIPFFYAETDTFENSISVIKTIVDEFEVDELFFNLEYEINERQRDEIAEKTLIDKGVNVRTFHDKCVFPPGAVLNKKNEYFKVFTPFKNAWLNLVSVPSIIKPQSAKPMNLNSSQKKWLLSESSSFSYPRESSNDWNVSFDGIRQQLRSFCSDKLSDYNNTRDFPFIDGTSQLSPYLAIGVLSVRQCLARVQLTYPDYRSQGADVWIGELIWREFYQHLIWYRQDLCMGKDFHSWGKNVVWKYSSDNLEKWQRGQTGYPIIDAAMRQLNHTGWMHNRLRMIVASFLIKDLHIDWREGEAYFMEQLIDGDFPANNGGWQWCASTGCDGQPYFRIFNPVSQSKKFDADGVFIKKWIPELALVPSRYIHEPWKWDGVKNLSYPEPMVDHNEERKLTLELYQLAKDKSH